MANLTERRFAAGEPILEKYRAELLADKHIETAAFERELRELWGLEYGGLKPIVIGLSKLDKYEALAAYYMQHESSTGIVSEYQGPLTNIYGAAAFYHADFEEKRDAYWRRVFRGKGGLRARVRHAISVIKGGRSMAEGKEEVSFQPRRGRRHRQDDCCKGDAARGGYGIRSRRP